MDSKIYSEKRSSRVRRVRRFAIRRFFFKQLGLKTLTNDFLNFSHQIGISLIENKNETLTRDDLEILFQPSPFNEDFSLMQKLFSGVFFEQKECEFLDGFRQNVEKLSSRWKRALALTIMNRSLTRKITMGHFCHAKALDYAKNQERIKRNRSLIRSIKEIFLELVPKYNESIFDNERENQSFNENILDLLPKISNVDLVYFDPPYCGSHSNYQDYYHLLETFSVYWKNKKFVNKIRRYEPKRFSGFEKKNEALNSFEILFERARHIPYWILSYNDRSYPNLETIKKIIEKHRDVEIETKTYQKSRGGRGSVKGVNEILFICKPKIKIFID